MNTRYYMVIIKGEIKTSEIMSCGYNRNTQKWDVKFNNGKTYSYAYLNVEKLTDPEVLNPNMYRISREGREFFDVNAILYLEAEVSLIGIFVLAMVVKEIIVVASYILLNHVLLRVNHQMYLNI